MNTGLVKLIESGSYNTTVGVGADLVEDPHLMRKSAATIFDCGYDELKPDKDHVGIHVVALGDFEHYGNNRNGDAFTKKSCVNYHHTFVKHGHVFRHHRNTDPEKSIGDIVKSAYNEPMGRIELFIHAHKDKASDELQKLASDGEIPFSMACRVENDRCSICDNLRTSSRDPNQCEHIRDGLGKLAEDGKAIFTFNDEPKFFDISFVRRPADRIAWSLKVASNEVLDSVKLAEFEGILAPDDMAIESTDALSKLAYVRKLAAFEDKFASYVTAGVKTSSDRYFWELRKAAGIDINQAMLDALRLLEPEHAMFKLAKSGVILSPTAFYKYALGGEYSKIEDLIPHLKAAVGGVYSRLVKEGRCQVICNDSTFDVDSGRVFIAGINSAELDKMASMATFVGPLMEQRVIDSTIKSANCKLVIDSSSGNVLNDGMLRLAEKYAAYKLSAVKAIVELGRDTDTDALLALAVAQNFEV